MSEYKITVHGIKGASFDVFANDIGMKAEELENAATNGDIGFIEKNNPAFLDEVRKFISEIEDMLSAISTTDKKTVKDKPDNDLLSKLLAACLSHNMDAVDKAMAEIEKFQYNKDDGLTAWLRENVDTVNYFEIADKLSYLDK